MAQKNIDTNTNDWTQMATYVLYELQRHNEWLEKISEKLDGLNSEYIAENRLQKFKMALIGGVAGFIPSAIIATIIAIFKLG